MSDTYNAVYYRNSHYSSAEEAKNGRALYAWEETYGYGSTMDSFINATDLLKSYDPSVVKEFRFIWTIDGFTFPETDYIGTFDLLNASYDGFKNHKDVLATGTKTEQCNLA